MTIYNQILRSLVDAVKGVVSGVVIRHGEKNSRLGAISLSGEYVGGLDLITVSFGENVTVNDVEVTLPYTLDGLTISGSGKCGDTFGIYFGDCSETIKEVVAYQTSWSNKLYPSVVVYPAPQDFDSKPIERLDVRGRFVLQLWAKDIDVYELGEMIGDITDAVMKDRRRGCVAIDTDLVSVVPFQGDSTDTIGANITIDVTYRQSSKNSRQINP